jgi:N6-adenosine-specific RNA methylase IME4
MFWPFSPLEIGGYDLVMIDPPWTFELYSDKGEEKSAQAQYDCMTMDAIRRLPVAGLGKPDCLFLLWATAPLLDQCIDTGKAWGLKYKSFTNWRKLTKNGKEGFGTGFIFRCASEPILAFTQGSPKTTRSTRTTFDGLLREHSRKPEEAYTMAEKLMPGARRADVFSRQRRPGWDSWGNELNKFPAVGA